MPSRPLILTLGEILWDLLPGGKQLGGAPANFGCHAAQLGADVRIVSAVGDDELGREILMRLRGHDLDTSLIAVDPQHPTGTVTVTLAAGQPTYTIHERVAWDFIPATPALIDLAGRADCVCFGTLAQRGPDSRETIRAVLSRTRPDSVRVFDINLRQHYYDRGMIDGSLGRATVLKINDQEIATLGESPVGLFSRFPGLRLIALTRGSDGSALYAADGSVAEHPGYPAAPMADAIGAGDAFTAALAVGLLAGRSLTQINDVANRLASYVCTQSGATPPIPAELRVV
jgi:fructokinase